MHVFYTFVFSVYQNLYIFLAYLNADFRLHKKKSMRMMRKSVRPFDSYLHGVAS